MKKIQVLSLIAALSMTAPAFAEGPGKGSLSKSDVTIGDCTASNVEVKWNLDSLMGEPMVNGSFRWDGEEGCEIPTTTVVWLKLEQTNGPGEGWVNIAPVIPEANGDFGYNVTGSPDWTEAVCGFNGTQAVNCVSRKEAKTFWKTASVTDFEVVW
ncbi:hypothetical protein JQX08_11555 [Pseudomonas sp. UL073]|uniref:Uncharacterized protein n=1 Tax=Zestomonas insulae TaxID=2809017 RepID=A0ABS2IE16_9GAMM|nr:hypothetical protein [Pseudomonas insulae]MBM7061341.1 hypothetical protein [Pseudomonas insulae]